MACFCTQPLGQAATELARFQFRMTPPQIPLALRLMAAFGVAMDPNRLDLRLQAVLDRMRIPSVTVGGPLASLAMTFQIAGGTFRFDDIPTLKAQMDQMAASLSSNVMPALRMLATVPIPPLLRLSLIAKLALQLKLQGIDPLDPGTMPAPPPNPASAFAMSLTKPQLKMATIALGLPPLLRMAEALQVPLGEPGAVSMLQNRLQMLAKLHPPTIPLPLPVLLRIAFVLQTIATLKEAFGEDAMTPMGLQRIAAYLRPFMTLSLPIPLPVLALTEKLDVLPPLEDVRIAAGLVGSPLYAVATIQPPKLAIAPFLNVMMALQLALTGFLKRPVLDQCAACTALA